MDHEKLHNIEIGMVFLLRIYFILMLNRAGCADF